MTLPGNEPVAMKFGWGHPDSLAIRMLVLDSPTDRFCCEVWLMGQVVGRHRSRTWANSMEWAKVKVSTLWLKNNSRIPTTPREISRVASRLIGLTARHDKPEVWAPLFKGNTTSPYQRPQSRRATNDLFITLPTALPGQ